MCFFFFWLSLFLSCCFNCARWLWEGLSIYCYTISAILSRTHGARLGDLSPWPAPLVLAFAAFEQKVEIFDRSPLAILPTDWGTRSSSLRWKRTGGFLFWAIIMDLSFLLAVLNSMSSSFEAADAINCRIDSLNFCSGIVCGGGGVSSEEGASRGTILFEVISCNVSNRVRR